MDIILNTRKNSFLIPDSLSEILHNKNFALLDIETTGLNPKYNKVILIGVLYIEDGHIITKQFFCNNSSEELKLLTSFIDFFKTFNFYITFNGGGFDIPFLNRRFAKYKLNYEIDPYLNFDLYKVVRKNRYLLNLNNCKLKTIEKYLSITREDTIDGAESIRLFNRYENTGDESLKKKILLHNLEDILHLLPTLKILNFIDKDKVFAHLPKEILLDNKFKIRIANYKIEKDFLFVEGFFHGNLKQDFVFYNHVYDFSFLRENQEFKLKIPLLNINTNTSERYSFINLNELDYIKASLSEIDNREKSKFLIKVGNDIKDYNIYHFVKDFSLYILKSLKDSK